MFPTLITPMHRNFFLNGADNPSDLRAREKIGEETIRVKTEQGRKKTKRKLTRRLVILPSLGAKFCPGASSPVKELNDCEYGTC